MIPNDIPTPATPNSLITLKQESSPSIHIKHEPTKTNSSAIPSSNPEPTHVTPVNWEQVFNTIRTWRESVIAPVDDSGCTALAIGAPSDANYRFQVLIALMLSPQTKDQVTASAMRNLQALGLSLNCVLGLDSKIMEAAINKVGFWRKKILYIQQTCQILKEKYNGDIPKSINDLIDLPGVGPKIGYLTLYLAWGINEGIGVDVHVHRITNRLGWVKTKNPEQTRKALESWLPKEYWQPINHVLVGFGQVQCLPIQPLCSVCPVQDLCPSNSSLVLPKQEQGGSQPPSPSPIVLHVAKRARRR